MVGGWIGAISYEFGYGREPRLAPLANNHEFPALFAGLYLWMASERRGSAACYLWVHPQLPAPQQEQLRQWLETPVSVVLTGWRLKENFSACQSPESFRASIERIKQYIRSGDCYQTNLSQMFRGQYQGDPWQGFKALGDANPTPYAAYLKHNGNAVLSISPERFLGIENRIIRTSPIKGTRPRGTTPALDQALATELLSSEKDRAENLMIADLLRNDLGLNAVTGSVIVEELFALESFRNVHHLVSHIRATLQSDISPLQAMFEAFPGGSITGAPKIRAMEIIAELEPHHRGPYCGSVFYYGLDGRLESNIAIRTLLCEANGTISCWGGGGIVADSDPEAEYQETLAKVGPLMRFLEELVIS
jgi:para-aminobenzoate synthetase component 1